MSVPDIPPATPEGRMSFPRTPVVSFPGDAPLDDLAAACAAAEAAGTARLAAAGPIVNSPAGYGSDGFNIEEGSAYGWPTDMEPPAYETPLRPGPHGG
jgi:hypothetical protein